MRKQFGALLVLIGLLHGTPNVEASIQTYTTRTSFDAAVGASLLETFNSVSADVAFHTTPVDVGNFTLSMSGLPDTSSNRNLIDTLPLTLPQFDVDGTAIVNALTDSRTAFFAALFFTFDTPITAFGADFAKLNDGSVRTRLVVNGDMITPPVNNGVRFFGFASDTPFTTVEFRPVSQNDGYGIDNVSFAQVPEPTTVTVWSLLGLAAGGIVWRRNRKM